MSSLQYLPRTGTAGLAAHPFFPVIHAEVSSIGQSRLGTADSDIPHCYFAIDLRLTPDVPVCANARAALHPLEHTGI